MSAGQDLAREFILGFRENLRCPDVAPSEYEAVMAHKIDEAILKAEADAVDLYIQTEQHPESRG